MTRQKARSFEASTPFGSELAATEFRALLLALSRAIAARVSLVTLGQRLHTQG